TDEAVATAHELLVVALPPVIGDEKIDTVPILPKGRLDGQIRRGEARMPVALDRFPAPRRGHCRQCEDDRPAGRRVLDQRSIGAWQGDKAEGGRRDGDDAPGRSGGGYAGVGLPGVPRMVAK